MRHGNSGSQAAVRVLSRGEFGHKRHGSARAVGMTLNRGGARHRSYGGGRSTGFVLDRGNFKRKRHGGLRAAVMGISGVRFGKMEQGAFYAALLTVVAVLCVGLWMGASAFPPRLSKADTAAGLSLLETLEQRDPGAVDALLRSRQPEAAPLPAGGGDGIELNEAEVWKAFHDYVLLGDSRAVGFYYYDFLDTNRVLADGGHTIRQIEEYMEEIVALQPQYIYLCYGLNDVSIGFWDTPEEYAQELLQIISGLEERLPGVKVVVNSTLPARDPAFEMSTDWYRIPEFNQAVAAVCQENGIIYVDNDAVAESYAELWQPDGIHLEETFYPHWAKNMIEAVWDHERETDTV